jgi:hypothetical protein
MTISIFPSPLMSPSRIPGVPTTLLISKELISTGVPSPGDCRGASEWPRTTAGGSHATNHRRAAGCLAAAG